MVAWHHRLNGHDFEQLGDSGGQGSLVGCKPTGLQRVGHNLATEQQQYLFYDIKGVVLNEISPCIGHCVIISPVILSTWC